MWVKVILYIALYTIVVLCCIHDCCISGCHDGRGAEEGAGHQRSFGENEEEPGGDSEGPAAPP